MNNLLTRLDPVVTHQQSPWLMRLSAFTLKLSKNFGWPILVLYFFSPEFKTQTSETEFWYQVLYYTLSALFFLFGFFLRLWSQGYYKNKDFVLDGPYRYVRNPVEISNILCFASGFLFLRAPWWYTVVGIILAFLWLSSNAFAYERQLYLKMGSHFLHYKKRVGRWLPSLLPEVNKTDIRFSIQRALSEEKFNIIWFLGFLGVMSLRYQSGILKFFK
jgi:protein-S-isoprenylcysteine O-methyltransferase Ste14